VKIYRNADVMWREETEHKELALKTLAEGGEAEEIGASILFLNGQMLTLNLLGTEIWSKCDGIEAGKLITDLSEVFDVDPETLEADVKEFLSELKEKGFIRYE
jgi:GeoRSP system PqqD family protein